MTWKMDLYRSKQFMGSSHAILKVIQVLVIIVALTLFLVGNHCQSIGNYITLFVLPCVVCGVVTLVSLASGLMVVIGSRNPLTTPTWIKGEVWFNVMAFLVMTLGSMATLTYRGCSDNSITVAAVALGFITGITYTVSAGLTYYRLVRYQNKQKETQHYESRSTVNLST